MIKPMLAYKVDAKPIDWSEQVYIQPKLDGVRCLIQLNEKGKYTHTLELVKNLKILITLSKIYRNGLIMDMKMLY